VLDLGGAECRADLLCPQRPQRKVGGIAVWSKPIQTSPELLALLAEFEKELIGLAYAHGYVCPPKLVKRGEELRAKIAELKSKIA